MTEKDSNKTDRLNDQDRESITSSGIDLTESTRSASFMQQDDTVLFSKSMSEGVEMMGMQQALETVPEAREHMGKAFAMMGRDYERDTRGGYFIRVKKGHKVAMPIQSCLFLKAAGQQQKVHNIIIVEEDASLYLITGCSASKAATEAFHLGNSEFFIRKGGYLSSTMVHSWKEDTTVRPVSIAVVEEGGSFISNYIALRPVKDIKMYPTAVLTGRGARASMNSLVLSHPGTTQDIGSRIIFKAQDTGGEIVSRTVSLGGRNIARGHLRAEADRVKAHLECRGLILPEEGIVYAIPELETDYRDVDMSHEAAIGRISREEIEYLSARGMSYNEAQSVIIRGFMDVNILSLPEALRKDIEALEEKTLSGNL